LAKDIAVDCKDSQDSQDELWLRISKDEYMQYAVEECFHTIYHILTSILDKEGHLWYCFYKIILFMFILPLSTFYGSTDLWSKTIIIRVQRIYGGIRESIAKKNIQSDIHFSKLPNVIAKLVAVAGILVYML
jgi:callose synthase